MAGLEHLQRRDKLMEKPDESGMIQDGNVLIHKVQWLTE